MGTLYPDLWCGLSLPGMPSVAWQSLLCSAPDSALDELQRIATHKHLHAGDALFRRGSVPRSVYILVDGEAVLVFRDASGNDIVFSRAATGEIFAITEAFASRPLKFGLVAMTECEAGIIERHEFESFMNRNRFPRERLIRELGKTVQASEKHLRIFA